VVGPLGVKVEEHEVTPLPCNVHADGVKDAGKALTKDTCPDAGYPLLELLSIAVQTVDKPS
jgi:hypothetical protein